MNYTQVSTYTNHNPLLSVLTACACPNRPGDRLDIRTCFHSSGPLICCIFSGGFDELQVIKTGIRKEGVLRFQVLNHGSPSRPVMSFETYRAAANAIWTLGQFSASVEYDTPKSCSEERSASRLAHNEN
jgi:hypothetical protein